MDLKLNVSKKGLSTQEEVINEEYTLRYGHIFRGPKGDSGEKGEKGETGAKGDNGKSPKISDNGTWLVYSDELKTFVDTGIKASGSDNNYTDADKALVQTIPNKVDKVEGKGLSTNDFTDEYKQKVEEFIIDTELSPTSDNAIANSAVVQGLAGLAEGVSEAIGNVAKNVEQNTADIKTKQDTLTLTTKPNGNIVIGNLVIGNLAGQTKEFMPATPSGDPMHDMYLTKKYVRWGKFEHNGITYGKEGYWSIWAELGGLDDITTAEMKQIWGEKRSVSLAGSDFAYTVSRTNIINNDSAVALVYACDIASGFRGNSKLVVANLVCANNTPIKCAPRDVNNAFNGCRNLKKILVGIDLTYCSATNNVFYLCNEIEDVLLDKLKTNISFAWSPLLSKESLLYMISNCASNATFTITLYPDVYAKCQKGSEWYSEVNTALSAALSGKNTTITLASA